LKTALNDGREAAEQELLAQYDKANLIISKALSGLVDTGV